MAESKSWNGDYMTCKMPEYLPCSPLYENGIINGTIYVKKKRERELKHQNRQLGLGLVV